MHVLIVGAAGMLGRKLADRIVAEGGLAGDEVTVLTLVDVIAPPAPAGFTGRVRAEAGDISDAATVAGWVSDRPDVIFHLAAIVSSEAEVEFDKGYAINLDGTRNLLEAIRHVGEGYRPRLVYSSSIAAFGAPFPDRIGDEFFQTPLTSYGAQKVIGELLLADYSRKGFVDGIGIRLPTVVVRPGKPNKAASGFYSSILREPLAGIEAVLPVSEEVRHWFASPRRTVGFLTHAAGLDLDRVGPRRILNMPGLSATVGDEIAALGRIAGPRAVALIRREPDPAIEKIIAGWARDFDTARSLALGFVPDASFDEIIRIHIEDDLGGRINV